MWHEILGIDNDCTQSVAKAAKCIVGKLKMLALVGHDEADDILCDKNRGALATSIQLLQDTHPIPKKAGPCPRMYFLLRLPARERSWQGERGPSQVNRWKIPPFHMLDIPEVEFASSMICFVYFLLFRTVIVCPERFKLGFQPQSNEAAASEKVQGCIHRYERI